MSFSYTENRTDQYKIHSSQDKNQENDTFLVFLLAYLLLNEQGHYEKELLTHEQHSSLRACSMCHISGQHHAAQSCTARTLYCQAWHHPQPKESFLQILLMVGQIWPPLIKMSNLKPPLQINSLNDKSKKAF